MKQILLWAGLGAIVGHFIVMITLISYGPTTHTESVLLADMTHASPLLFALPIFGALTAVVVHHITRLMLR